MFLVPAAANGAAQPAVDVKSLHAKIGALTLENDFLGRSAQQGGIAERKAMIDRGAQFADHQAGGRSAHQPWQRLLPAAPSTGSRPRNHAASRPAAFGVPFSPARGC